MDFLNYSGLLAQSTYLAFKLPNIQNTIESQLGTKSHHINFNLNKYALLIFPGITIAQIFIYRYYKNNPKKNNWVPIQIRKEIYGVNQDDKKFHQNMANTFYSLEIVATQILSGYLIKQGISGFSKISTWKLIFLSILAFLPRQLQKFISKKLLSKQIVNQNLKAQQSIPYTNQLTQSELHEQKKRNSQKNKQKQQQIDEQNGNSNNSFNTFNNNNYNSIDNNNNFNSNYKNSKKITDFDEDDDDWSDYSNSSTTEQLNNQQRRKHQLRF